MGKKWKLSKKASDAIFSSFDTKGAGFLGKGEVQKMMSKVNEAKAAGAGASGGVLVPAGKPKLLPSARPASRPLLSSTRGQGTC